MASPQANRRSPLTVFYAVLAVVAVVGVGVLLYQVFGQDPAAMQPVAVEIDPAELSQVQGIAMGREDAPVVIYEFADFQCPACATFATFYGPQIKEKLVDTGLVRYVYYDFPLTQSHPNAFITARAGRCANEQGQFWLYHDYLFARQQRWATMSDPVDYLVELAGEAGLDEDAFEACLRSDRYAEEVTRSMRLGESLGVPGTPTLFINGKRLQQVPSPFSRFEEMVREEAGLGAGAAAAETE